MKTLLSILAFAVGLNLFGQVIMPSITSHTFSATSENQVDSVDFTVQVSAPHSVEVVNVYLPEFYGHQPFDIKEENWKLPGANRLYFEPEHNIQHQAPLILETDSFYGCFVVDLQGQGVYSRSYYQTSQNLDGTPLFNALKNRISSPYTSLSYNSARDEMYADLDNNGGSVECVYTGRTATFSTRSGANSNSFNCEHTWPQSLFSSASPMRSDIHHLFPTDVQANSQRGNLPFGVVSGSVSWQQGGSKKGGGVFEPRDSQKGATARAMMYFVMRYQDYSNFYSGQEIVLRQWHSQFPPNTAERDRNQGIYLLQDNRNPFVDYPQLADRLGPLSNNGALAPVGSWAVYPPQMVLASGIEAQVVVYNSGSIPLNVQSVSPSDNSISVAGFVSGTIAPGDYEIVRITPTGNQALSATLSVQTDQGTETTALDIISLAVGVNDEASLDPVISISPSGIITADWHSRFTMEIIDLTGKELVHTEAEGKATVEGLPKGMHLVRLMRGGEEHVKQVVIY
jgi:endonuclease I